MIAGIKIDLDHDPFRGSLSEQ